MRGRLVSALSERTIWCSYSSHSSVDEIIDFLSSLQLESITHFVCPKKETPLDYVEAFILITPKHQNPNTSNDSSIKLWKEKIKFNKRGKHKLYLEKVATTTPDYEYHSEPFRQQRRFGEDGVFEGKDSETAKTAEETNFSTKKEEISVQLSKNTIEPSCISSQMLKIAMIISESIEPSHLKN